MINWNRFQELVVLTGAGVSVASGLETYRGKGGLWENSGVAEEATAECMERDPWRCWKFFRPLMEQVLSAKPNPAHLAMAELERKFPGEFLLITQNVDGLHRAAGSIKLAEIHGSLLRRRCSSSSCALEPFEDRTIPSELPLCSLCGCAIRPDIVLFGEQLPLHESFVAKRAFRTVDLFIGVGTSGTVQPAASYVSWAKYAGATTVEINPERTGVFCRNDPRPAEVALPDLISTL